MGSLIPLERDGCGVPFQTFDAFGNNMGGYILMRCDHDMMPGEYLVDWDPTTALPIERMQTGIYNWRGGEGSITDWLASPLTIERFDLPHIDRPDNYVIIAAPYTRPSSGLIYMRNRYYDPETGRFTQADIAVDPINRWVYATNDPINFSDPHGLEESLVGQISAQAILGILLALLGLAIWLQYILQDWSLDISLDWLKVEDDSTIEEIVRQYGGGGARLRGVPHAGRQSRLGGHLQDDVEGDQDSRETRK